MLKRILGCAGAAAIVVLVGTTGPVHSATIQQTSTRRMNQHAKEHILRLQQLIRDNKLNKKNPQWPQPETGTNRLPKNHPAPMPTAPTYKKVFVKRDDVPKQIVDMGMPAFMVIHASDFTLGKKDENQIQQAIAKHYYTADLNPLGTVTEINFTSGKKRIQVVTERGSVWLNPQGGLSGRSEEDGKRGQFLVSADLDKDPIPHRAVENPKDVVQAIHDMGTPYYEKREPGTFGLRSAKKTTKVRYYDDAGMLLGTVLDVKLIDGSAMQIATTDLGTTWYTPKGTKSYRRMPKNGQFTSTQGRPELTNEMTGK